MAKGKSNALYAVIVILVLALIVVAYYSFHQYSYIHNYNNTNAIWKYSYEQNSIKQYQNMTIHATLLSAGQSFSLAPKNGSLEAVEFVMPLGTAGAVAKAEIPKFSSLTAASPYCGGKLYNQTLCEQAMQEGNTYVNVINLSGSYISTAKIYVAILTVGEYYQFVASKPINPIITAFLVNSTQRNGSTSIYKNLTQITGPDIGTQIISFGSNSSDFGDGNGEYILVMLNPNNVTANVTISKNISISYPGWEIAQQSVYGHNG